MADKQSRLAEIYKAEKAKGGGVLSTLGKRAKEKFDPRQMFNQKGFAAAVLPSVFKAYDATDKQGKLKQLSEENKQASVSSAALESGLGTLISETRELTIHSKLAAKNSIVLPSMARDMNVMRQNVGKLVKLQGGTATTKADMFFKRAGDREAAYESKFNKEKPKTPTQDTGKDTDKKKSIFSTIVDGLSSIFSLKGALIAGILAAITLGIKEYFSNDEFKGRVDALVGDMFSTIKGFLIEHWKEVAVGLALLFPKETMSLISSGVSILSSTVGLLTTAVEGIIKVLGSEVVKDSLAFALRGAVSILASPVGLIAMLGLAAIAAKKFYDTGYEDYKVLADKKRNGEKLTPDEEKKLSQSPAYISKYAEETGYDVQKGRQLKSDEKAPTTGQAAQRNMKNAATQKIVTPGYAKDLLQAGPEIYEQEGYTKEFLESVIKENKPKQMEQSKVQTTLNPETELPPAKLTLDSTNKSTSSTPTASSQTPAKSATPNTTPTASSQTPAKSATPNTTPTASSQTPANAEPLKVKKLSKEQSEMATLIYNKFTAAGFNDAQATAAVVNSFAESSLNPKSESRKTDKEASYGLFQMNTKGGLGAGHDPEKLKDPNYNIDLMIQAAKGKAGGKFRSTTTVEDAITAFTKDLERPANADAEAAKRVALASAITNYTPTAATAVASNSPEKIKESSGEPKVSPMEQVFNSMLASSGIDITKISPDVKESAGKINQATTQVAETKESKSESQSPIVNNVTNNINNSKSSGGGSSASTASVYDDLFAKLVERALA
jgi:hypothetical protein